MPRSIELKKCRSLLRRTALVFQVIAIEIQHANPYYDDSYAVNSANLGPY